MLNRDACARRQAPPRATLRCSLGLSGGTAPAAGCIRRRKRRATERRRAGKAGKRRIELSLFTVFFSENFYFSDQHRKLRGAFCFLGRGRRGTDWN